MKKSFAVLVGLLALCAVVIALCAGCGSNALGGGNAPGGNDAIKSIKEAGGNFEFGEWRGEPVLWRVLEVQEGKALVISEDILCVRQHDSSEDATMHRYSWEDSEIRAWLNGGFLSTVFSADERQYILQSTIMTSDSAESRMDGVVTGEGMEVVDSVFLLSSSEARKYFSSAQDGLAEFAVTQEDRDFMMARAEAKAEEQAAAQAEAQDAPPDEYLLEMWETEMSQEERDVFGSYEEWLNLPYTYEETWYYDDDDIATENYVNADEFFVVGERRPVDWWLRSRGFGTGSYSASVTVASGVSSYSFSNSYYGVRPAMWVDIDSDFNYKPDEATQSAPEEYRIIYDLDGGLNAAENPATYTAADWPLTIRDPSKEGWVFAGWVSEELDRDFPVKNIKIRVGTAGDVTLSAIFNEKLTLNENIFDFAELLEADFPRGTRTINQLIEEYGEPQELVIGYGEEEDVMLSVLYEDIGIFSGYVEPYKFSFNKESVEDGRFDLSEGDKNVSFDIFIVVREENDISLPRDIKIGVSTKEQVLASYPEGGAYPNQEVNMVKVLYGFLDENGELPTTLGWEYGSVVYNFDENNILQQVAAQYGTTGY